MIVEIVCTGSELLLGQIINTNSAYLAQKLNALGFDVLFQSCVGDNRKRMAQVLRTALNRSDIVVTTGGLGPTLGDITKEVTAELLGRRMLLHERSLERIKGFFAARQQPMPESNIRQAMIPEGATVLDNDRGTAPGVILEADNKIIVHLPGPPLEIEGMFDQSVAPYLKRRFPDLGIILSRVLRSFGLGESALEEKIQDYLKAQSSNPTIALLARSGEIHIRLTAKAATEKEAARMLDFLEEKIRERIGDYIFGLNDQTLELVVGSILTAKKLTVAFAESCTGGLVSSRITDIPGSSEYLTGSVVCYNNSIKSAVVGVPNDTLAQRGAVSAETAVAMAEGIRTKFSTDLGVGITGIAGPGGAVPGKPVGLVYIAVAGPHGTECHRHLYSGLRTAIKLRSASAALDHLRRYISTI